ncbi:hypothetical protein SESBI_36340 [Sesbania bispinosa]|nr:hypothetical protein SESBI_36340 [Sesbania bispinosa]
MGVRKLVDDEDATTLANYAEIKKCEVDIYVEQVEVVVEIVNNKQFNRNNDEVRSANGATVSEVVVNEVASVNKVPMNENIEGDYSSDDYVKYIHFNDSEKERDLGGALLSFLPSNVVEMLVIVEEYNSEELENDLDGSDIDGSRIPKYLKYNKEDICKTFKFKLGMEFTCAILEHSILNGRQVKFVKNDSLRVRVVRPKNCDFTLLVSKVGDKNTYRLKTLFVWYNCGEVFHNKNSNTNRVAKIMVDKFRKFANLTVSEIIVDVRKAIVLALLNEGLGKLEKWLEM